MRFLDISAITEPESNTQQVEGHCACNTLCALWDFSFSRQDLLLLQNESSCGFSQKSSPHGQSSLKHLLSSWL